MFTNLKYHFILSFNLFSLFHFNTNYTFLENKFFYLSLFFSFSTFFLIYKFQNFNYKDLNKNNTATSSHQINSNEINYDLIDYSKLNYSKIIELISNKKIDVLINQKIQFYQEIQKLLENNDKFKKLFGPICGSLLKNKENYCKSKLLLKNKVITEEEYHLTLIDYYFLEKKETKFNRTNIDLDNINSIIETLIISKKTGLTFNDNPEFFLQIGQTLFN